MLLNSFQVNLLLGGKVMAKAEKIIAREQKELTSLRKKTNQKRVYRIYLHSFYLCLFNPCYRRNYIQY